MKFTTTKTYELIARYPHGLQASLSALDPPIQHAALRAIAEHLGPEATIAVLGTDANAKQFADAQTREAIADAGFDPDKTPPAKCIEILRTKYDAIHEALGGSLEELKSAMSAAHGRDYTMPADTAISCICMLIKEREHLDGMVQCDVEKLRSIFARGLVIGPGTTDKTCIGGAIALACGLPLTDAPPCVAPPDRMWARGINNAGWSTSQARSGALLPIALAQVSTAGTGRQAWVECVVIGTFRRVLPFALRHIGLEESAAQCESVTTLDEASAAAIAADNAALRVAARDTYPDPAAAAAAYEFIRAPFYAAVCAAAGARDGRLVAAAYSAAYIADRAAADIAGTERDRAAGDNVLRVAVNVALSAYRDDGLSTREALR